MTEIESDSQNPIAEYPCGQIVYRGLRSNKWIDPDTRQVTSAAFVRRPTDIDGLSVALTVEACIASLNKSYGTPSLHVGRIRDIGLDVKPDEDLGALNHGNIIGVPYRNEDPRHPDTMRAEYLAGQLAKQARLLPSHVKT